MSRDALSFNAFIRRNGLRLFLFIGGSLALATAWRATAGATPGHLLIVPSEDGYGVENCLASGADCGRIVADAWCTANGRGAAQVFGRAGDRLKDFLKTRDEAEVKSLQPDALVVSCSD